MKTPREEAVEALRHQFFLLQEAQKEEERERSVFAQFCNEAHEHGIPDREIHELTRDWDPTGKGYSRARIQQFRCGDPRKKVAA